MKILGLDTGTTDTGWVIYDSNSHSIDKMGIDDNDHILTLMSESEFDFVALEMVASYGMPVGKTTFETVYWIGRFVQKATELGVPHARYYKKVDINPTICLNSQAKDKNIRRAILDMFPKTGGGSEPSAGTKSNPGPLYGISSHMYAALAVALTHALKANLIEYKLF